MCIYVFLERISFWTTNDTDNILFPTVLVNNSQFAPGIDAFYAFVKGYYITDQYYKSNYNSKQKYL